MNKRKRKHYNCVLCGIELTAETTYPSDYKAGSGTCKHCRKKQYKKNITKEKQAEYDKTYRVRLKDSVLSHYGRVCACCGEDTLEFLTIDHCGEWGAAHRKELYGSNSRSGSPFYQWLKNNNFPNGFQTLCMNCNTAFGFHGFCPHLLDKSQNDNCIHCNTDLSVKYSTYDFFKHVDHKICSLCVLEFAHERTGKHKFRKSRKDSKSKSLNLRLKLIKGYGGKCACCDNNEPCFLTIDHINNDGADERRRYKNDMGKFYRWLSV